VGCTGLASDHANPLIDRAFAAVADVHRLMSFHEPDSDVTRLNQAAADAPVGVDPRTRAVLSRALELAEASDGLFDITVADRLVAWGRLPRPPAAPEPDPAASWRDVELMADGRVRFHRPLWLDLGGIAKGYAVDQAVAAAAVDGGARVIVNAGGDLRVAGQGSERIALRTDGAEDGMPVIDLEDGALASSSGRGEARRVDGRSAGPHLDGRSRRAVGARAFVSVLAQDCMTADALTKVVLAAPKRAGAILQRYGATAFLQSAGGGWTTLGASA
jgi:thiamine biosynthesis lipoprotein